jgi:hypothetical protein
VVVLPALPVVTVVAVVALPELRLPVALPVVLLLKEPPPLRPLFAFLLELSVLPELGLPVALPQLPVLSDSFLLCLVRPLPPPGTGTSSLALADHPYLLPQGQ